MILIRNFVIHLQRNLKFNKNRINFLNSKTIMNLKALILLPAFIICGSFTAFAQNEDNKGRG